MSQQTQSTEPPEFGPNQWLVDALHEQWTTDPASVDPSWAEFFRSRSGDAPAAESPSAPAGQAAAPAEPAAAETSAAHAGDAAASSAQSAPEESSASAPEPKTPAEPQEGAQPEELGTDSSAGSPEPGSAGAPAPSEPASSSQTPAPKEHARVNAEATSPQQTPVAKRPSISTTTDRPEKVPTTTSQIPAVELREPVAKKLRGPAAAVVRNMDESLTVPTATSVRDVPVKLLFDNRMVINNHLKRNRLGKVSFTHLIGWAMIEALTELGDMNNGFDIVDGKPVMLEREDVNFGLAIDMPRPDGSRGLVVPNIKAAQRFDFYGFWKAYEEVVKKARNGKLTMEDFTGTTVTLTNPGGIGTVHSIPRLMKGQGCIIGVGAMDYPAQFQGMSPATLADLAVSKVMTLTSTYDHRIIQGAASGEFLKIMADKLLGHDGYYDRVFASLRIPYEPVRWVADNPLRDTKAEKYAHVMDLIHAFRVRGHLMADTDPLQYRVRRHPDLDVATYGLTLWDLDRSFPTRGLGGKQEMTLREILGVLSDSYCRSIGVEYMHITDPEERLWLQEQFETPRKPFDKSGLSRIMDRLNAAEAFETFLQTKFVGQKRFSLEGGETIIPMLDSILHDAAHDGVQEVCIGMAHRGRLNVLSNLAGKKYGQIFQEFEGNMGSGAMGSGDVKYHLGTEGTYTAHDGETTKVYLAANPSHLEAVNPVLEGIVRAKQDAIESSEGYPVLPILIHGDAAFAGQGVVTETLNLSELRGYRTGGTVHVIINNQIGFTTLPDSSRSSYYSSDVAKSTQLPIFHVNGDDPEACVRAAEIAFRYRQKFQRDVVIDMVCYRRRGHNEGDDPSMTQPLMYQLIHEKPSVRKLYTEALIERGDLTEDETQDVVRNFQKHLDEAFASAKSASSDADPGASVQGLDLPAAQRPAPAQEAPETAVTAEALARIGEAHEELPEGFTIHPKLAALAKKRAKMAREGGVDWAYAELLAFGTLLMEGQRVRLAGQDSRRGTFTQRHSVFIDHENQAVWTPLANLTADQARFNVYDSSLSEFAALGFEYGYSVESTDSLVLWEAQFGDFVNGAQTIIDEFISASEQKWGQRSSVVMLLPHGYEGQGPDHSSARLERFLQLCAEENMRVAVPSTPANYFHLLRRQAKARPRKPLIVMTPKSMLRNKAAVSSIEDFTAGGFQSVIPDATAEASAVHKVLLTSGKLYWELTAARESAGADDVAIVRIEQLYPLPADELRAVIERYPEAELAWVQEEPSNQGAWSHMAMHLPAALGRTVQVVARPASASPATGSARTHKTEQQELISLALGR